jgi:hypothetical protein
MAPERDPVAAALPTTVSAEPVIVLTDLPRAFSSPPTSSEEMSLRPAESPMVAKPVASPALVAAEALAMVVEIPLRPALEATLIMLVPAATKSSSPSSPNALVACRPELKATSETLPLSPVTFSDLQPIWQWK